MTDPAGPSATAPARAPRTRRRHVAQGSRILAAGLGASTMFGIVTVLGLDNGASGASTPTPVEELQHPATPPPVQVVIHRVPASTPTTAAQLPEPNSAPTVPAASEPVQLTATPVVKTITVTAAAPAPTPAQQAPAPEATTSGSN